MVQRLPLRVAASVLVPELVDPVRRRPARRQHDGWLDAWAPPAPARRPTAGYDDDRPPTTGLLVDLYC